MLFIEINSNLSFKNKIFNSVNKTLKFDILTKFYKNQHSNKFKKIPSNIKKSLFYIGTNLNSLVKSKKSSDYIGRDKNLLELLEILSRKYKNNAIITGKSGIGKTTFIQLLAFKILNKCVPFVLQDKVIISINFLQLLNNAILKNNFISLFKKLIKKSNVIIFFDDFQYYAFDHEINELLLVLKSYLALNKVQCIITLFKGDKTKFLKDNVFINVFDTIHLKELNSTKVLSILYNLRPEFESFYNIRIKPGVLKLAVLLARQYIPNQVFPQKAISLIDTICSTEMLKINSKSSNIYFLIDRILIQLKLLRLEAFRKNNIEIEFILSQIEHIYLLICNSLISKNNLHFSLNFINLLKSNDISKNLCINIKVLILKELNHLFFSNKLNYLKNTNNYSLIYSILNTLYIN